jgi:hypothetical protein
MNPSLALIPSAYKAGKLYSVLPEDGTGDFDVSRNGSATYLGSDGLIKTAQANEPRLEFNPDGTFKGVLVETAATNLALRSQEFQPSTWDSKNQVTVLDNQTIAPDGTLTACRMTETTATNLKFISQFNRGVINTQYTLSFFAKADTRSWIFITFGYDVGGVNNDRGAFFNLADGTIGLLLNVANATIQGFGNGWYRCSVTATMTGSNPSASIQIALGNNQRSYTGDGTSGIFIWGAQLEVGSVATSYIPTVASTVTRPADLLSNIDNSPELIPQGNGYIFIDFIPNSKGTHRLFHIPITNNVSNARLTVRTGGIDSFFVLGSETNDTQININFRVRNKLLIILDNDNNTLKVYLNGILETTLPYNMGLEPYTQMGILRHYLTSQNYFGHCFNFSMGNLKLTDSQAIALTTL